MNFTVRSQGFYAFFVSIFLLLSQNVEARPEFALRHNLNRCTSCHFSPAGGGLKTTTGKLYGAHGFKISKYASQDFVSAEMRMAHYNPSNRKSDRSGLFMMSGIVGGSIAITPEEENTEVRAVISHDIYNSSAWDSYLRWRFFDDTETSWAPQYILVGRFHAPFGLLTDEHRTYTKLQTLSNYNLKLEAGAMLSGQPFEAFHYDLAVVNGEASNAALAPGNAELWGGVSNFRFSSSSRWFPVTVGMSYKFHDRLEGQKNPWAGALYGMFSLERFTQGRIKADVIFEYANAKNFNDKASTSAGFPVDATYKANILDAESEGIYSQVNFFLTEKLILQVKYDRWLFNKDFPADAFEKLGYGLKHYFEANSLIMLRFESSRIGRPEEQVAPHHRADDAAWVYMQVGI
ncbi:MAG: hypothetical protein H6625_11205 [Bdellovibrionaceae bacterium]|nr:hypothetical protein [Pseudobdellovibrionaceae bacterium]